MNCCERAIVKQYVLRVYVILTISKNTSTHGANTRRILKIRVNKILQKQIRVHTLLIRDEFWKYELLKFKLKKYKSITSYYFSLFNGARIIFSRFTRIYIFLLVCVVVIFGIVLVFILFTRITKNSFVRCVTSQVFVDTWT